jgi:hypothetical protein
MNSGSFSLTPAQITTLDKAEQDPRRQDDGMAKWEVYFSDGRHGTMLTNDCRDRASALLGAIERFGAKVTDVK